MKEHTDRINEEMGAAKVLPSQAAAAFTKLLTLRDHIRAQPKSLINEALLSILLVQGECFREARILWTDAHQPGSLDKRDAAGEITVRLAAPNEAIEYMLAAADEIVRSKT